MSKDRMLQAIKGGLKGELDSINLYQQALVRSDKEDVKTFFAERLEEEKNHYNYLLHYYNELSNDKQLSKADTVIIKNEKKSPIITIDFLKRIASDQQLFSAISTAVLLELNAIQFYKKCIDETDEPELQKFYTMMAAWEGDHYHDVLKIQEEAEHYFWDQNRFEPF